MQRRLSPKSDLELTPSRQVTLFPFKLRIGPVGLSHTKYNTNRRAAKTMQTGTQLRDPKEEGREYTKGVGYKPLQLADRTHGDRLLECSDLTLQLYA
jgi:hypothetical protein